MFELEPSTIADESPEIGQEEVVTEEQQETEVESQEPVTTEAGTNEAEEEAKEETPSEEPEKGNFDYVKAYNELRKDHTRKSQELADFKRQATPPAQAAGQGEPNVNDTFWQIFQQDPMGTIDYLVNQGVEQKTAPIFEQRQTETTVKNLEHLATEYKEVATQEGLTNLFAKVGEIADELGNPKLKDNPTKRVLDMAAREAFGDSKAKLYEKAKAKGKEEMMNSIRTKQGLTATSGTKPKSEPMSIEDQIADSIVGAGRKGGIFG